MTTARFKSARLTNSSAVSTIDNALGELEQAICAALGLTIDSDVTVPIALGGAGSALEFAAIAAATTLSSYTDAYFTKKRTLAAGALNTVGKVMRIRASGFFTDTTPPGSQYNFGPQLKIGGQQVFAPDVTGNHIFNPSFSGTHHWELDVEVTVRTTGATAVIMVEGRAVTSGANSASWGHSLDGLGPTFTIDLTGALDVEVGCFMTGGASASRTAGMRSFTIEIGQAAHTA